MTLSNSAKTVDPHKIQLKAQTADELARMDITQRLIHIGFQLSREKDLSRLMHMITMEAMSLTGAVAGTLYLVDLENQSLLFFVSDSDKFNQITLKLSPESIAGYVGVTGQLLNIPDVYELDPTLEYKFNKSFDTKTGFRTKSMLVMPLFRQSGDILGVLQLINKKNTGESEIFTDLDVQLGTSLASQASVAIENTLLYKEIEGLFDAFVRYSATAIDARDPCTGGHSRRVAMYSVGLAIAHGSFTLPEIKEIYYAAWLHDIGKIGVREAVLTKANKLTDTEMDCTRLRYRLMREKTQSSYQRQMIDVLQRPGNVDANAVVTDLKTQLADKIKALDEALAFLEEINVPGFMTDEMLNRLEEIFSTNWREGNEEIPWLTKYEYDNFAVRKGNLTGVERQEMESHVQKTFEILKQIPFTKDLSRVPEYAGKHHEKLDSTGYPHKIPDNMIPVAVRILTIADIYDALVAQDRPYKKAMPIDKALKILSFEAKDGKLDQNLLDLFVEKEVYLMEEMPDLEFTVGI